MAGVLSIHVELRLGARAVLRRAESSYRVEIYWETTRKGRAAKRSYDPKSVCIVGNPKIGLEAPPDLNQYFTAYFVHIAGASLPEAFRKAPVSWPTAGQRAGIEDYEQLLSIQEALIAAGHSSPAKELAKRYGVAHGTMRSRLSRGRKYLDQRRGSSL